MKCYNRKRGGVALRYMVAEDFWRNHIIEPCKGVRRSFPWKSIWWVGVPCKIAFFTWIATLEAILAQDNSRKRGEFIVNWVACARWVGIWLITCHCIECCLPIFKIILSLFGVTLVLSGLVLLFLKVWTGANIVKQRQKHAIW